MTASVQRNSTPRSSARSGCLFRKLVGAIQYPENLACSYVISPRALISFRIFAALFLLCTACISIANQAMDAESVIDGLKYIFYFTNLNLYSLISYFALTIALTHRANKHTIGRRVSVLHALLYTLNCTFHPLVVIVYWVLLRDNFLNESENSRRFVSVSAHGVTLFLLLSEVGLGAMRIVLWQFFPVVFTIILYTLWALIYYALSGVFVYAFLDFNKPAAAYLYPGVFLGVVFFFFLMLGIHYLRDSLFRSKPLIFPIPNASSA